MERLTKYKKAVEQILGDQVNFPTDFYPHLKDLLVIDKQKNHFMVVTFGWDNEREYVNEIKFHVEVNRSRKVIIHENITDIELLDLLIEGQIKEEDILDGLEETFPRDNTNQKAA
ncbi:MAG: element excision factor XisI family protein [Bacteroidota bacterium]